MFSTFACKLLAQYSPGAMTGSSSVTLYTVLRLSISLHAIVYETYLGAARHIHHLLPIQPTGEVKIIGLQLVCGRLWGTARRVHCGGRAGELTRCGGIIRVSVPAIDHLSFIDIVIRNAIGHHGISRVLGSIKRCSKATASCRREKLTLCQFRCCFVCSVCDVCLETPRNSRLLILGLCICVTIYKKERVLLLVCTERATSSYHVIRV
jgi:hypothetical protein